MRVETEPMIEHAVLAELLPMVRGDDDERIPQQAAALELIEQRADLPIQGRDAIVVGVASQLHVVLAELELVPIPVFQQHLPGTRRFGAEPEVYPFASRREERLVR